MGGHRVRSKSAKKGARWSKGHSSASNPASTRHRDAAKARTLRGLASSSSSSSTVNPFANAPGKLTAESLVKHDAFMAQGGNQDRMDEG